MMTERANAFSGPRLCLSIELFQFCGSFSDLAHESCIEGANHLRGGVLKSTLVVDKDSVHTYTACIVRSAQTSQPFTGFTQLVPSVSMCTINVDNCLFLFSRFPVIMSVLCVHIGVAALHQIHHRLRHPSSCSGVWDPWSVEYHSCKFAMFL